MSVNRGPGDETARTMRLIEEEGRARRTGQPIRVRLIEQPETPAATITTTEASRLVDLRQAWASRPGQEH